MRLKISSSRVSSDSLGRRASCGGASDKDAVLEGTNGIDVEGVDCQPPTCDLENIESKLRSLSLTFFSSCIVNAGDRHCRLISGALGSGHYPLVIARSIPVMRIDPLRSPVELAP